MVWERASEGGGAGGGGARHVLVPVEEIHGASLISVAHSLLQAAGIPYYIGGERLQELFGWGSFGTGYNFITSPPIVFVTPSALEEARELLRELPPADLHGDGP